jgi:hypothetical protein
MRIIIVIIHEVYYIKAKNLIDSWVIILKLLCVQKTIEERR